MDQDFKDGHPVDNVAQAVGTVLAALFFFAVMNALIKHLSNIYPILHLIFFRNFFAIFPVLWMIKRQGGVQLLVTERPWAHILRAAVGLVAIALIFLSFKLLPLADAVALHFATPLIVTALSIPLLGEKVGIYRTAAVVMGLIGVLIIINPTGSLDFWGTVVALGAAVVMAFSTVLVRVLGKTEHSLTTVFYFTVFSTGVSGLLLPLIESPAATIVDWGLMALLGICAGLGQILQTSAYRMAPAAFVSPFNYTSILYAALLGYLIWGEIPETHTWIGAGIVIASGLFILWREAVRKVSITRTGLYGYQPLRPCEADEKNPLEDKRD